MSNEPSRDMLLTSIIRKIHDGLTLTEQEKELYERVLRGG